MKGEKNLDLSIITVVLNDYSGLLETVASVKGQNFIDFEHIIVDGGSTDGSAQLAAMSSSIHIESKSDGGIYPAMKRGSELATGKYLLFCNSGDPLLGNEFLYKAIQHLNTSGALWGFGPIIEKTLRGTYNWIPVTHDSRISLIINRKNFVPFPSFIINHDFFMSLGGLTSNYKIAGDFELICKAALQANPIVFEEPIAVFSAGGVSYSRANEAWMEELKIRKDLLRLSQFKSTLEWANYVKKVSRWNIGKLIDFFQALIFPKFISWRDTRARQVPERYLKFLIN